MTLVSSLYLHVPFCRHLCNYCDFYKKSFDAPGNQIEEFNQFLEKSFERHSDLMRSENVNWAPLETVYLGGGTPSLWGSEGARFYASSKLGKLTLASDLEFTMEIDPGTWNEQMLLDWQQLGMNRISIGTQTLNPNFLKIMDRSHTIKETKDLLTYCQDKSLNYSIDFLLGLPFSQKQNRDIEKELRELLSFAPKHISLYILNARSKYPHTSALPDDEFIRKEYLLVSEILRGEGFHHYEVSNFALPGFESRHNRKYWRSESVAALGPTGVGLFSQNSESAFRYKWKVSRPEVEVEILGVKEINLEQTYLSLRTSDGWRPSTVSPKHVQLFEQWVSLKYANWLSGVIKLTPLGYLMLDSLMDDLFRISPD
jgi:oxygen-independent coproporphyrinogen-3 oxidase